VIRNK